MVETQLRSRGIHDPRVLDAFLKVPRHFFVPQSQWDEAYADYPLPIGEGQTISQPWIVAYMLQELKLAGGVRVLDVGTGSGYQAALLAEMGCEVYAIERIAVLMEEANARIQSLGYTCVRYHVGDGTLGWPEHAPYDRIMVTAAPDLIPPALLNQLGAGGRMVIPTGIPDQQQLLLVEKSKEGRTSTREILAVRFSELEEATGMAGRG
jgi:protein-L-isoaspartate(D-aspartate) O-methyltransferase